MQTVCKLYRRVAFSHTGPKEAIFTRLRCKQWSCDYCAAKNASIWRAFLKQKLPEVSTEWWLLTLTAHRNTRSTQGSLKNIRKNFDAFIKRCKRVFGKVSYVRTYEKHPTSKAIHLHAIFAGFTPYVANGYSTKLQPISIGVLTRDGRNGVWTVKTWVKKTSQDLTMGLIADVRLIQGEPLYAVLYVCKYLTKAQQELNIRGLRHVQTTRDIGSPRSDSGMGWQTASYITARTFTPNTKVLDLNTGEIIDNDYWEQHSFYPYDD